jgi:acyl carrier protein
MVNAEVRVKKVMSKVFNIKRDIITDETSPDTVGRWDSLQHMNLVLALEEEFGVEFTGEQMNEMLNFRLILIVLQELLNKGS